MKTFTYTITDELGIHARPAGILANAAKEYTSKIMLQKDGKEADAIKILAVMGLCVKKGDTITVNIKGDDEEAAYVAMQKLMKESF